ncbi:MAG TPA: hypothetical protein VMS77_06045 [Conexivisphaerales archaeon]|nr:hypothetical protein [Conexivisphaerales archaeon]
MPTRKETNELKNRRERLLLELAHEQGDFTFDKAFELLNEGTGQAAPGHAISKRAVHYRLHDLVEKGLLGYDPRNKRYVPGELLSAAKPQSEPSYDTGGIDIEVKLSSRLARAYELLSRAWLILDKVPSSRRDQWVEDTLEEVKRKRLVARRLLGKINGEWLAEEFGGIDPHDLAKETAAGLPPPSEIGTTGEFVRGMSSVISAALSGCHRLKREMEPLPEGEIKAFLTGVNALIEDAVRHVVRLGRELSLEAYSWRPEGFVQMRVKNTGREKVLVSGLECDGETKMMHVWYNEILPGDSAMIEFSHRSPLETEHDVNVTGEFAEYPFKLRVGRIDEVHLEDILAAERRRMGSRESRLPLGVKKIGESKPPELPEPYEL